MEILREGPEPKRLTCYHCSSLLEYEDTDVSIIKREDGSFGLIKCPICKFINRTNDINKKEKFYKEEDFEIELDRIKSSVSTHRGLDRDCDMSLKYHSEKYKDSYEFCLNHVKLEARNLAFVPEKYRDYEMCIEAVTTLAISLSKIDDYNSHDFSEAYIENLMTLFLIPERIRTEKFVLEMLNIFETYNDNINYGFFIAYVPIENITKKLCIECVKYGANVNDIPVKFIDSDLCKLCIDSGGDMYDIETLGIDNDIIDKLIEDGYLEKCDNRIFISKKYRNY